MTDRRAIIDMGPYTLDVTVPADADLDGTFRARCNDTGDTLKINGWLIESIDWQDAEPLDDGAREEVRQAARDLCDGPVGDRIAVDPDAAVLAIEDGGYQVQAWIFVSAEERTQLASVEA